MKRTVTMPAVRDEQLARIVKAIYTELAALWEKMPETGSVQVRQSEGEAGDVRIATIEGVTYIQAKGKDGWVQVEATKVSR